MSCFTQDTAKAQAAAPVPTKHVNFVQGMVLGVDDFTQEFAYLANRDQWLARDLIGYGTARGLAISTDVDKDKGLRVKVAAGAAVSPCGQLICVPRDQCAFVNDWLAQHGQEVSKRFGAGVNSGALDLHVVLSYRDCQTDAVPIPGEPCRSEDELKQPSRIADDFLLELVLDPPKQREEDAVRAFMAWLRAIPVLPGAVASTDLQVFLQAVRDWKLPEVGSPPVASPPTSPPGSPPVASPPAGLVVRPQDADLYLREALRVWVTELRPRYYGRTCGCAAPETCTHHDDRLLLATLTLDVELPFGQSWRVKSLKAIDEIRRPFLLHLRAALERLLVGAPAPGAAALQDGGYRVVAAGWVPASGPNPRPVFGGVVPVKHELGKVTFWFPAYRWPNPDAQYVIKVLAVSHPSLKVPAVHFLDFNAEGFVLQVTQGVNAVKPEVLAKLEFMIEVSMFQSWSWI